MSKDRSITPNDPANFTPVMGDYKSLQPFRFWCQKVLPLVYDDSLSYYELLCKVVDYLNKTMEDVETLHGDVTNLHQAYVGLQGYVNNYFSTLDVQEEINNKLDEMAENGELNKLIAPLLPDLISDWLSKNITTTTPPIDKTLSISGAGADAKTVGERLLKNGFSYGYQYEKMRNYRGTFDNTVYNVNGSCIMNGENYSKATLGTTVSLVGFGYTLFNEISLPKNDTYTVYYLLDLRNTVKQGNMSFSLWLSDSTMNWTDEHVVYGGKIKANFGELNILSSTIKKGSSNLDVSNVILRVDNISSVPENMDFSFILFTNDFVYNLVSNKLKIDKTLKIEGECADAKTVGERLLKNGFSYGYQYEKMRNYRGTFDNTVYNVNGSCIMNGENYSKATLGTTVSLVGFGYTLFNEISLPKNDTYTVYYLLDLRNTVKQGNMSFSLWLSDSTMNWTDEHVVYGGKIKANFGELNILSSTIKKGSSNLDVSNVILRVDNISSVPENMDFSFILFTNDFVYNLISNKTTQICFWGDSLTAGAGGGGTTYPKICCDELGITDYLNCGVGGESANTISCRQGGNSLILPPGKVNKYTLSQLTDIFGHPCNPLRQGNGSNSVNPITINGIKCEITISQTSITDSSATYTITGYNDELLAETPVKFNGCNYTSDITVIFVGQNGPGFDERLKIIDSMISKINEKYIVMGLSSGSKESMETQEEQMLSKYGVHFFNTRNMLSKYGINVMKITPTATDVEEMNVGKVPTSLRSDSIHLNAKGYTALGKLLAQKIRACGYIN